MLYTTIVVIAVPAGTAPAVVAFHPPNAPAVVVGNGGGGVLKRMDAELEGAVGAKKKDEVDEPVARGGGGVLNRRLELDTAAVPKTMLEGGTPVPRDGGGVPNNSELEVEVDGGTVPRGRTSPRVVRGKPAALDGAETLGGSWPVGAAPPAPAPTELLKMGNGGRIEFVAGPTGDGAVGNGFMELVRVLTGSDVAGKSELAVEASAGVSVDSSVL